MPLDPDAFDRGLEFDPERLEALRRGWLAVADLAVWGAPGSSRLGAVPRLRKRALDLGEKLAALGAPRAWIPHPRERAKSALATALAASEALGNCEAACGELEPGAARDGLTRALAALRAGAQAPIEEYAERCARLLETARQEEG